MIDIMTEKRVSIYRNPDLQKYFRETPFHPSQAYPEYPFAGCLSQQNNEVYDAVRSAIHLMGLDEAHYGTPEWNPFGEVIHPGDKVVIKPNFVLDKHYNGGDIESVISQPSVIRAVCDYAYIALKGEGELVIADAPQANCNFDNLLQVTQVESISRFYQDMVGFSLPIYDLRQLKLRDFTDSSSRVIEDGDPLGYAIVDLNGNSSFVDAEGLEKLYGADYDRSVTRKHHHQGVHEYCVSKTILSADVVISLPKMKVHRKAGVTLNLKNLIGINGNKNYLPHFRIGVPEDGGDEFSGLTPEQRRVLYTDRKLLDALLAKPNAVKDKLYSCAVLAYRVLRRISPKNNVDDVIRGGDWHGNDTIWRTLLDLNKILLYADIHGQLHKTPQRKFISVVDGIIAGENEGPLVPTAKPCGVIACGLNPLVTDLAVARIMGFDVEKVPKFKEARQLQEYPISRVSLSEIEIISNIPEFEKALENHVNRYLGFIPSRGWVGTIESSGVSGA